jgi:NTE family protein
MMMIERWRRWFGRPAAAPPKRCIALALQGGGSHGAFTWGVLDRLLEDGRFEIGAISGTSAGALNGAVLVSGHAAGGASGARAALAAFWRDISAAGAAGAPTAQWVGRWFGALGPYELNPLNLNPLRDVLRRHVDEAALRRGVPALHVAATAVRSGRARIFSGQTLGIDALLASACLPMLFRAVEIDGAPYWDGGYSANPAILPLLGDGEGVDVILVRINPLWRAETPTAGADIADRVNELVFNASLLAELRALAGRRGLRLHAIADDDALAPHGAASKLSTDRAFLQTLFSIGREAATRFLARHGDDVGRRASFDVAAALADQV